MTSASYCQQFFYDNVNRFCCSKQTAGGQFCKKSDLLLLFYALLQKNIVK